MPSHRGGWLTMIGILLPPTVAAIGLYVIASAFGIETGPPYTVLALLAFLISLAVYREMASIGTTFARRPRDFLQRSIAAWAIVVSCLAIIGFALQHGGEFSRRVLLTWAVVTPVLIAACQYWGYVIFVHNMA